MSAHTPGSWEAQQQDRVLTGPHREKHASWFVTAEGPSDEEGTHICSVQADDTGKATAANAALIAAAPDLLEAVKGLLPWGEMNRDKAEQDAHDALTKAGVACSWCGECFSKRARGER